MIRAKQNNQRGISLVEYVLATAVLLPIFILAGIAIENAVKSRTLATRSTIKHMTPENQTLSNLRSSGDDQIRFDNTYQDEH